MISPDIIGEYDDIIEAAAHKYSHAAEYEDLYQEGLIAIWKSPPDTLIDLRRLNDGSDRAFIRHAVEWRMRKWVRYIKRLRHNQSVSYTEMVDEVYE